MSATGWLGSIVFVVAMAVGVLLVARLLERPPRRRPLPRYRGGNQAHREWLEWSDGNTLFYRDGLISGYIDASGIRSVRWTCGSSKYGRWCTRPMFHGGLHTDRPDGY